jgi:hypothetical protein
VEQLEKNQEVIDVIEARQTQIYTDIFRLEWGIDIRRRFTAWLQQKYVRTVDFIKEYVEILPELCRGELSIDTRDAVMKPPTEPSTEPSHTKELWNTFIGKGGKSTRRRRKTHNKRKSIKKRHSHKKRKHNKRRTRR